MSEIVMPECMKQRRAKLLNATYEYFLTVLEMDRNEAALRVCRHHAGTIRVQRMLSGHLCAGWEEDIM